MADYCEGRENNPEHYPGAEAIHTRGFFIGVHQVPLSDETIDRLAEVLLSFPFKARHVTLVTGASGMVGRHVRDMMMLIVESKPSSSAGVAVKSSDDDRLLVDASESSRWVFVSSADGDLRDVDQVRDLFRQHLPTRVLHLAAHLASTMEMTKRPVEYWLDNIAINNNVLQVANEFRVRVGSVKVVSVLSTAMLPAVVSPSSSAMLTTSMTNRMNEEIHLVPQTSMTTSATTFRSEKTHLVPKTSMTTSATSITCTSKEIHSGPPPSLVSESYAYAKRALDLLTRWYRVQYQADFVTVLPGNIFGAYGDFDPRTAPLVNSLIAKMETARIKGMAAVEMIGTGRPRRQVLWAGDLARVLVWAMDHLDQDLPLMVPGVDLSIQEIAEEICDEVGFEGKVSFESSPDRDGPVRTSADGSQFSDLLPSFEPLSFREGVRRTLQWYRTTIAPPSSLSPPSKL